jgi:hypothetical protein
MSIKNLYPTTFPVSSIDFVNGDKTSSASPTGPRDYQMVL